MYFDRKAYPNFLEVFDICLELLSDSEKYFGFEVDELFEIVHTKETLCSRHLDICGLTASQTLPQNLDGISHSNLQGVFDVCLELRSNSRKQFGFVIEELFELEHKIEF